jgi:hypothetical protein
MQTASSEGYADPRDRQYADSLAYDERMTVLATVERFRRPDRLRIGDALPQLDLLRLDDGTSVPIESLVHGRPLVLVFGSFT